ncbi:CAF17-like 4Fe-4S cluster assembly/insertion protein YgfZ [Conchiformibius steedae]|uniref:Folate-binding protein n=1 Tax=Conchiformibius steedae TaxID=153493 RepID=A0A3P2AAI9_9NEIS|nr:folate-binding protein YgfZ [Conchiformibius steedae]RRD91766.1 folate-binding protein [Conchiformibius steedae]
MTHTQLPFFAVVRVSGADCRDFLHRQLSNDINNLPDQHACYATYNTPKGRVIANMLAYRQGDEILLALAADMAESVVKRLKMFVLRSQVQLEILTDWGAAGQLHADAPIVFADAPALVLSATQGQIALPHGGTFTLAPLTELPPYDAAAEAVWNTHEIRCGYPWIAAATAESCVAQMLNQHTIGGVHFRKGCYPGQEIIARAQYRGQVKRGLAVLTGTSPLTAGDKLTDPAGAEAGIVINAQDNIALAVIKYAANEICDSTGAALAFEQRFFDLGESE